MKQEENCLHGFLKTNRKGVKYMKKWYERFHDDAFTLYNQTGEAAAVYIVRDLAADVNTTDKWIDVISMNTFDTYCDRIGFNWIIVELFPRITHPDYTDDKDYNKYLCWHAAHEDIAIHRSKNHHGEKFLILCKLYLKEKKISKWGKEIPIYDYKILASHSIQQKKIRYIEQNAEGIVLQIKQKRKPTLSMFHIVE